LNNRHKLPRHRHNLRASRCGLEEVVLTAGAEVGLAIAADMRAHIAGGMPEVTVEATTEVMVTAADTGTTTVVDTAFVGVTAAMEEELIVTGIGTTPTATTTSVMGSMV